MPGGDEGGGRVRRWAPPEGVDRKDSAALKRWTSLLARYPGIEAGRRGLLEQLYWAEAEQVRARAQLAKLPPRSQTGPYRAVSAHLTAMMAAARELERRLIPPAKLADEQQREPDPARNLKGVRARAAQEARAEQERAVPRAQSRWRAKVRVIDDGAPNPEK